VQDLQEFPLPAPWGEENQVQNTKARQKFCRAIAWLIGIKAGSPGLNSKSKSRARI